MDADYTVIYKKYLNRNKKANSLNRSALFLFLLMILSLFSVPYLSLFFPISVSPYVGLILVIIFLSLSIWKLKKAQKIELNFREKMFLQIYEIYDKLDEYGRNPTNDDHILSEAIDLLKKFQNDLSMITLRTGFKTVDKLYETIGMLTNNLNENIKKWKKNDNTEEIGQFKTMIYNILVFIHDEDLDKLYNIVKGHYKSKKEESNLFLKRFLNLVSLQDLIKWFISFLLATGLIWGTSSVIGVSTFSIDVSSVAALIIAFCVLTGGIKKYVMDQIIKIIFSSESKKD